MDNRAYHLQPLAHQAVAVALSSGRLVRSPCEVCGGAGQAHHDSYLPERWLDVRWICAKHHREWHDAHQPEWPTIFDYHPSDYSPRLVSGDELLMRAHELHRLWRDKGGRPPAPWYRKSRGEWYVCFQGKQHRLGKDRESAFRKFFELLSSQPRLP